MNVTHDIEIDSLDGWTAMLTTIDIGGTPTAVRCVGFQQREKGGGANFAYVAEGQVPPEHHVGMVLDVSNILMFDSTDTLFLKVSKGRKNFCVLMEVA